MSDNKPFSLAWWLRRQEECIEQLIKHCYKQSRYVESAEKYERHFHLYNFITKRIRDNYED